MPDRIQIWAPSFRAFGGGIAAFSRELVIALLGGGTSPVLYGRDDRAGAWSGCRVHGAGAMPLALRKYAFALQLMVRAITRKPSLVICTHLNFAPIAWMVRRLLGVPYVVVAHGIDVHPHLSAFRRKALLQADAVWAVSRWTRDRILQLGAPESPIQLVGNTVDADRFVADSGHGVAPNAPLHLAANEKILLTVARLDPGEQYKGYDTVLRAMPRLQALVGPVRYLIVGTGADRARVEALAIELGVGDNVTFCGFVADADLPAYYRLADLFVMPSRGEGFGIVFLEAMASGTPVLGGNQDGTVDALSDGALGALVDPEDPEALADELHRLLQGMGPPAWFEPNTLRDACLSHHGRAAFAARIANALPKLHGVGH